MCSSKDTDLYYVAIAVIVVTSLFYCRRYIRGTRFEENVRADGKIVAVTGANSGIGQAITAELNRRGATVYMLIRDKQRGLESISRLAKEGCDPKRLILRHVDLALFSSVRSFVEEFCKEVPRLDILICNAGVLWVPTFTKTADGFEKTWQCNYLGHFLLTQLLLPLICKSSDGRIINVSSMLYEFADSVSFDVVNDPNRYGGMMAYSRSKMAQVMYTWYLARLLERKNLPVTVTACHPGNVDTNILKESGFQWVRIVFRPLMWFVLKTQNDGAQMPLFLALSEKLQNSNGHYFRFLYEQYESSTFSCLISSSASISSKVVRDLFYFLQHLDDDVGQRYSTPILSCGTMSDTADRQQHSHNTKFAFRDFAIHKPASSWWQEDLCKKLYEESVEAVKTP